MLVLTKINSYRVALFAGEPATAKPLSVLYTQTMAMCYFFCNSQWKAATNNVTTTKNHTTNLVVTTGSLIQLPMNYS